MTMKKYIRKATKVFFATALITVLYGCETELLEPNPLTSYDATQVFTTPQRVEQQVNNLYDAVKAGNFLGSRYLIYQDIRAEEFINRLTNGVTGLQTWNHTLVESNNEVNNSWNAAYAAINQINVFIEGMEANKANMVAPVFAADYTTTKFNNFIAEARFLRAVSYYYLLQLYARPYIDGNGTKLGVPLRLKAERDFEGNDLARATTAEVYAQILADLNFAETNLPLTVTDANLRTTRAHVNSAIAFKSRVYLTMGDYANTILEAEKIVSDAAPFKAESGVPHQLQSNVASVFATPYTTLESIFSFPFTTLDAPGTQNQLGYYYLPTADGGNGEYFLNTTAGGNGIAVHADWPTNDARRVNFVKKPTGSTGTTFYLFKYTSKSPYLDSSPIIRYAEVLLNLAEARARTNAGVDTRALELLEAVRSRSTGLVDHDANVLTAPVPEFTWNNALNAVTNRTPLTNDELLAAIAVERRIEFLGEGLRSIDLMRLNQTIPGKSTISSVAPSDPNYVWPMPSGELSVNKLLVRN
jgi:starch-binding outer membrane protein, SusD/RagB family